MIFVLLTRNYIELVVAPQTGQGIMPNRVEKSHENFIFEVECDGNVSALRRYALYCLWFHYTPQYALHTLCVVHTDDTQYFNMQYIVMDIQMSLFRKF